MPKDSNDYLSTLDEITKKRDCKVRFTIVVTEMLSRYDLNQHEFADILYISYNDLCKLLSENVNRNPALKIFIEILFLFGNEIITRNGKECPVWKFLLFGDNEPTPYSEIKEGK